MKNKKNKPTFGFQEVEHPKVIAIVVLFVIACLIAAAVSLLQKEQGPSAGESDFTISLDGEDLDSVALENTLSSNEFGYEFTIGERLELAQTQKDIENEGPFRIEEKLVVKLKEDVGLNNTPSILFMVYELGSHKDADAWVAAYQAYQQVDPASTKKVKVDEKDAVQYSTEGMFVNDHVVVALENNAVLVVSVGYDSPTETIRKEFNKILTSVKLK